MAINNNLLKKINSFDLKEEVVISPNDNFYFLFFMSYIKENNQDFLQKLPILAQKNDFILFINRLNTVINDLAKENNDRFLNLLPYLNQENLLNAFIESILFNKNEKVFKTIIQNNNFKQKIIKQNKRMVYEKIMDLFEAFNRYGIVLSKRLLSRIDLLLLFPEIKKMLISNYQLSLYSQKKRPLVSIRYKKPNILFWPYGTTNPYALELITVLLKNGLDINLVDEENQNCINYLIDSFKPKESSPELINKIDFLISHGADIYLKNKLGISFFDKYKNLQLSENPHPENKAFLASDGFFNNKLEAINTKKNIEIIKNHCLSYQDKNQSNQILSEKIKKI